MKRVPRCRRDGNQSSGSRFGRGHCERLHSGHRYDSACSFGYCSLSSMGYELTESNDRVNQSYFVALVVVTLVVTVRGARAKYDLQKA